jgi:hypothetical protein
MVELSCNKSECVMGYVLLYMYIFVRFSSGLCTYLCVMLYLIRKCPVFLLSFPRRGSVCVSCLVL